MTRFQRAATLLGALALAMAFVGAARGEEAARHPLTVEDLFAAKRLADPQVSPDGKSIAYAVSTFDMEKNQRGTDIWLMPSGGGRPRLLTRHEKVDTSPRWLPDGSGLLFVSTRSGLPQVWHLRLDGGEPRQVTDLPSGASGFSVGPRGDAILVASDVFADCADLACTRARLEEREKSPVKARVIDSLMFRVWDSWREGMHSHVFVQPVEGGEPRDLMRGPLDCPPLDLGSDHDFVLSPDGAEVAYVVNTDKGVAWSTNNDIFLVPTKGGSPRRLTPGRGNDAGPLYSPNGRFLAYTSMERPGFEADRRRLVVYDRTTKRHRVLTDALDLSVDEVLWTPDSKALLFTAEEKGRVPVFRVDAAGGRVTKVVEDGVNTSLGLLPNGRVLISLRQSQSAPNEIFRQDLDGGARAQLTHLNEEMLERVEMGQVEEFWYPGARGDQIRSWLIRPPGFQAGRRYPVVFLIHGGPQGSWLDDFHYRWNTQMFAAPGYVVVAMDFHGSQGYGQAFTDAVSRDWGGAPYEDVMAGVDYVLGHYDFVDGTRIAAAGASYGGFMVNWILGRTDRFRCLITHAGLADQWSMYGETEELWFPEWEFGGVPWEHPELYDRFSPIRSAAHFSTPTLVIHGEHDYRVPFTQGLQIFTALQRRGVESRLLFFPDETHFVQSPQNARLWWSEVHGWLARFLTP